MKTGIFKLLLAALFVAALTKVAGAGNTQGEDVLTRAAIQVQRTALVEKNMQMDVATAKVFWPLYNDYLAAMKKPNDRASVMLTEYAANWMNLSDDQAKSLISDMFSIKEEQLKVKKTYLKKFSRSLPPKVVARFFQIDNKLDAIVANELAQNVPLVH